MTLIGAGTFLLYQNAESAIAAVTAHGTFTLVSGILLALVPTLHAGREQALHFLLEHALISLWPTLLVAAGTLLARIP